jgi:HEPN domain-containing protein
MSAAPDANLAEAQRWIKQATDNLAAARHLAAGKFWPQACFDCQQAAETALKAVLVRGGERNFHTHSTARLVKAATAYQPAFVQFALVAPLLDRHYVGTRYPNGVASLSELWEEADYRQAEEAATRIVQMAERTISPP